MPRGGSRTKGKKIKYPKTRRKPVKHRVRAHTRDGHHVKAFTRGSRTPQRSHTTRRRRVTGRGVDDDTSIGVHAFTVNFQYSEAPGDGESVIVLSDNFQDATDEAWEERIDSRMPISVETVDPDIGAALKWVGQRVRSTIKYGAPKIKKAAHLGAKYAVRATMATGRTAKKVAKAGVGGAVELGRLTAFGVEKEIIQSLLKLCYQKDKVKRTAARVALKRRYPDVAAMCDWSRETRKRPKRVAPEVFRLPKGYKAVKI